MYITNILSIWIIMNIAMNTHNEHYCIHYHSYIMYIINIHYKRSLWKDNNEHNNVHYHIHYHVRYDVL